MAALPETICRNDAGYPAAAEIPETVNEAWRRLLLDGVSLLPPCDMPVARMLFAEWWAEQREVGYERNEWNER